MTLLNEVIYVSNDSVLNAIFSRTVFFGKRINISINQLEISNEPVKTAFGKIGRFGKS